MENSLVAIFLGMIAAIGWGVSGFFDAKASRSIHPITASLLVNSIVAVGYALYYALFLHTGFDVSAAAMAFAATGGVIITVGAIAYFKGLHVGPVSLVSPMSSAYPLITTLLAVALFHGHLSQMQLVAVLIIIIGIFTVTELLAVIRKRTILSKGPLLGLLAALCWGIGYALVAQAVLRVGWEQATLIEFSAMLIAFTICIPLMRDRKLVTVQSIRKGINNRSIWIAGLVALIAATSFNIGLAHDTSGGAIVATISSFYPILTVVLALRHFSEKVYITQLSGAALSIGGVILLGLAW